MKIFTTISLVFNSVILLLLLAFSGCQRQGQSSPADAQLYQNLAAKRIKLSNGWSLTPAGNKSLNLNDLPLNLVVSSSGKYAAVTNNGQSTQSITLIDAVSAQILDDVKTDKSYYGLAFSADEKMLYASGGNDNKILIYRVVDSKLIADGEIVLGKPWPEKISPVGLCIDDAKQQMFVVTKDNNSLYVCDLKERKVIQNVPLDFKGYACQLSKDKKQLL
ncbi:MAG: hypothetical protein R2822_08275 [Spirosomataceae bacterium]